MSIPRLLILLAIAGCATAPAAQRPAASGGGTAVPRPMPAGALSEPRADAFPSTYRPFPAHTTVIRNVHIFTGAGPLIRNGALLLQDGKVAAIGQSVTVPEGATVIDGQGKFVTPGLIDNGPGDAMSFNVRNIRQEAGNAVAYGLSWEDALRAITLVPAEVMGVANRVGAIAEGRNANIVIWSGDPFEFSSVAERVFVRGRESSTKSRQDLLTERYRTLPGAPYRP